jgi:hypothetical protein
VSNPEEVVAAEAKMNAAKDALLNYIEGREVIDRERHRRLLAKLQKAQSDFLKASSELGE